MREEEEEGGWVAGWGGGKIVQEVCVCVENGGSSQSLGSATHGTEMIEMNPAGSLVWGSLLLAQHYKTSPEAV